MKCKGAIFDMDGVLFDTEKIYQRVWHELAKEYQVQLGDGFLEAISGTNGKRMCQVVENYYHVSDGSIIMNECMKRVRNILAVDVPMKEGVTEILQFLSEKNVRMAVASSSPIQQIEANLKKTGICGYFDNLVCGMEVKSRKPAPDIFLCAAERIGCEPQECFVFEDSENGVRAGHAAGCVTIMVPDLIAPASEIMQYCFKICSNLRRAQEEIKDMV